MRNLSWLLPLLLSGFGMLACSEDSNGNTAADADTDGDADSDSDGDTDGDTDADADADADGDADVNAAHYYIDPAGNDANSGTTAEDPWATMSKIPTSGFGPGTRDAISVHFKRGGSWTTANARPGAGDAWVAYGDGERPIIILEKSETGTGFSGGFSTSGNNYVEGLEIKGNAGVGVSLSGGNNTVIDCEIDGSDGYFQLGFSFTSEGNKIIGNYVHDLFAMSGDSGNVNTSGGSEGYMVMASNNEVAYNSASECHGINETLGGEEGGCYEIVNPAADSTIENVTFHHNYCDRSIGLFEGCSGNFQGTDLIQEHHGIIANCSVSYNLSIDAMWLYLLQPVNTDFVNLVFEHNTLIHSKANDTDFTQAARNSFGLLYDSDNSTGTTYTGEIAEGEMVVRNNLFVVLPDGVAGSFFGNIPSSAFYNNAYTRVTPINVSGFGGGGTPVGPGEIAMDDPLLTAEWRLTATSPVIDLGSPEQLQAWTDYDGNPVPCGTAPDIGAFEYCAK
jgi:hypothetical protein